MSERVTTDFVHVKKGWPVVISQGIGGACWGAYLVKTSGSLQRFKPIDEYFTVGDVIAALFAYWRRGKNVLRKEGE